MKLKRAEPLTETETCTAEGKNVMSTQRGCRKCPFIVCWEEKKRLIKDYSYALPIMGDGPRSKRPLQTSTLKNSPCVASFGVSNEKIFVDAGEFTLWFQLVCCKFDT